VARRQVKEYRPDEALSLISADRETRQLNCPSCGSDAVERTPGRGQPGVPSTGRVVLCCGGCGRLVTYVDTGEGFITTQ